MWWLLDKPFGNKKYKRRCGIRANVLGFRFGLGSSASIRDANFVLLPVSAFPKSVSVEEVHQMNGLNFLVADTQLN